MRRTTQIQSALCSPDPGEAFRYLARSCKCYRNFLGASEVSELLQKLTKRLLTQNILGRLELDFTKIHTCEVFAAPFFPFASF